MSTLAEKNIGSTIRMGWAIQCLPFYFFIFKKS